MIRLGQGKTRTLVAVHGWSGISLGLLLYAVVLTGMVAVFAEEIAHWSAGIVNTENPLAAAPGQATPLQDRVDLLATQVEAEYLQEVALGRTTHGHLEIFFHKHRTGESGEIEEVGTQFEIDSGTGETVARSQGTGLWLFQTDEDRALARFLVSVHTELHLPRPWGLLLTGILGLAMMVAVVSGLLVHRHLIKDIFTLRARAGKGVLGMKDAHTVAGSWGLPYAFVLAFTGSFFSFSGSFGLPLMAMVGFGGDQQAMFEAMLGSQAPEDPAAHRGAAVDDMIRDVQGRSGMAPDSIVIEHFGRADASANFFLPAPEEGLAVQTLVYNGATGEFLKNKPVMGQAHSVGSTLFSVMGPLHFGNFFGLLSKAVWAALAFAMCLVTISGMRLWLARREADAPAALRWALSAVTLGLPLALLGSAVGFFAAYGSGTASFWTPAAFLIASGAIVAYAIWRRRPERLDRHFRIAVTAACLVAVVLRIAAGGPSWPVAIAAGQPVIVTVDLLLLCAGAALWLRRGRLSLPALEKPVPAG